MATDDPHAALRTKILGESLATSNEPKWGYFGVPGALAIGDNSYAPRAVRKPKTEEATDPVRGVLTCPTKKGSAPDVYFKFESPLAIGDPYVDIAKREQKGKVVMLDPDAAFRPPGAVKTSLNKLGYQYVEHMDTTKDPKAIKEKYKDYMPPRQIYSAPCKKGGGGVLIGGVLFGFGEPGKFPEHVPDDFDAPKKQRLKELNKHQAKVQELPFKGIDYGNKPFHAPEDVFGGFNGVPTHVPRDPQPDATKPYPHEAPFRPGLGSLSKTGMLGSFPEHVPDPVPGGATRKPKNDNEPPSFKVGFPKQVSQPTPSVTMLTRNMRAERPSSFMRPSL